MSNLILDRAQCICCGSCLSCGFDFLEAASDGSVIVKEGTFLSEEDAVYKELCNICPCQAFSISINSEQASRIELMNLIDRLKNYKMSYVKLEDIPFQREEYRISLPVASGEHQYVYSSDSSANSAARSEFNSKMYSHIDTLILKVITDYRVRYLYKYYSKDENSAYFICNKKIEELLKTVCTLLRQNGGRINVSPDFYKMDFYPENDTLWKMLNQGELLADEMVPTIRSEFNSNNYTSLSSYESYWDTGYMEVYSGTNWRGELKFKDKYCYRNMYEAFSELAKDIISSCYYKDDYLKHRSRDIINSLIDVYNTEVEKRINHKLKKIESEITRILRDSQMDISMEMAEDIVEIVGKKSKGTETFDVPWSMDNPAFLTRIGKKNYYYNGEDIVEKTIKKNVFHTRLVLKDRKFDYFNIIGFHGHIMFCANNCLWTYDCSSDQLQKIREDIYRLYCYDDKVFYTVLNGLSNNFDRYNSGAIGMVNVDGSDDKILKYTSYGNGIIFIKKFEKDRLYFETVGSSSISGYVPYDKDNGIGRPDFFKTYRL